MELSNLEFWVIAGVVLIILEIVVPSFLFFFFGFGALVTALFTFIGITENLTSQLLVFIIASGGSLLGFRKQLLAAFKRKGESYSEMINEKAKVTQEITKNKEGKVFFRGADWIAYTQEEVMLSVDSIVKITKVDGIKLEVAML